jgi:hypothetical protein
MEALSTDYTALYPRRYYSSVYGMFYSENVKEIEHWGTLITMGERL